MRRPLPFFIVMVLAQWLVPAWSIHERGVILREGDPFNFRTAPVDPHDPFRGEYVILRFAMEDSTYLQDPEDPFTHGEKVVVLLSQTDGEAVVAGVQRTPPETGSAWLYATVMTWDTYEENSYQLDLPFDRYYLEQGTGRRTEELVQGRPWDEEQEMLPAHAVVRVLNGRGAVEELILGGRSIREIILEERAQRQ